MTHWSVISCYAIGEYNLETEGHISAYVDVTGVNTDPISFV